MECTLLLICQQKIFSDELPEFYFSSSYQKDAISRCVEQDMWCQWDRNEIYRVYECCPEGRGNLEDLGIARE